jgi:hypothetical protein
MPLTAAPYSGPVLKVHLTIGEDLPICGEYGDLDRQCRLTLVANLLSSKGNL